MDLKKELIGEFTSNFYLFRLGDEKKEKSHFALGFKDKEPRLFFDYDEIYPSRIKKSHDKNDFYHTYATQKNFSEKLKFEPFMAYQFFLSCEKLGLKKENTTTWVMDRLCQLIGKKDFLIKDNTDYPKKNYLGMSKRILDIFPKHDFSLYEISNNEKERMAIYHQSEVIFLFDKENICHHLELAQTRDETLKQRQQDWEQNFKCEPDFGYNLVLACQEFGFKQEKEELSVAQWIMDRIYTKLYPEHVEKMMIEHQLGIQKENNQRKIKL